MILDGCRTCPKQHLMKLVGDCAHGAQARRAVFVDRDGVICRNRDDHVKSWEELPFSPAC